jgi:hypothetical protein
MCIMEFEADEEVTILACHKNHILHKGCYEDLKSHCEKSNKDCTCPVCRVKIDHSAIRHQKVTAAEAGDDAVIELVQKPALSESIAIGAPIQTHVIDLEVTDFSDSTSTEAWRST